MIYIGNGATEGEREGGETELESERQTCRHECA